MVAHKVHVDGFFHIHPLHTGRSQVHMVISAPLTERKFWSSKRRLTLLLIASARLYGWFLRSVKKRAPMRELQPLIRCLSKTKASWQPIKAACVEESANRLFKLSIWAKDIYFALNIYSQTKQDVILVGFWNL